MSVPTARSMVFRLREAFYYWAYRAILPFKVRSCRGEFRHVVAGVRRRTTIFLTDGETHNLVSLASRALKVPGDLAEVGVYRGATALLLCAVKGHRPLHLFDTFAGLPPVSAADGRLFRRGQFHPGEPLATLKRVFGEYPSVHMHQGIFPSDTGHCIAGRRFSFVHLDVDIHRSTLEALEFFYPRMNAGGVILSHDYTMSPGVRKAFDEFFADKPEVVLGGAGSQCMVVKVSAWGPEQHARREAALRPEMAEA